MPLLTKHKPISLLATCITVSLSSANSLAQSNDAEAQSDEQLTITAQRLAADNNYSIDQINTQNASNTHISEVLNQSSGTWISRGNGQENLTAIRSPVFVGAGACGAFLMSEANIPLRANNFCNANQLFDANYIQADGIEVLKGPGTVVHGSNAIHGVINIIPPQYQQDGGKSTNVAITDSSHGFNRLGIDHRSDNLIVQALLDDDEGYKDDSGYKQQKLRLQKLQQLNSQWQVDHQLNAMHLDQETAGYVSDDKAYKDKANQKANNNPDAYRKAESYRYAAHFEAVLDDNRRLVFSPYLRHNDMEFAMHWLNEDGANIIEENAHSSIGLQSLYLRPYGNWQVQSGFDLDYTEGDLQQYNLGAARGGPINIVAGEHFDYAVNALSMASFAQGDYEFSPSLSAYLGARIDYVYFDYTNKLSDGSTCDASVAIDRCRYFRPSDTTRRFYDFSPKLGLNWQYAEQHSFHAHLGQSHRSPQATELFRLEKGQAEARIDSVEADSLELIVKGQFSPLLSYTLSAYAMKKRNVIKKNTDNNNIDGQKTSHQGVEAKLASWLIPSSLKLDLSYAYAEHKYDSDAVLLFNSAASKGDYMDTAPRQMGNGRLSWFINDNSSANIEIAYIGDYYIDASNSNYYEGHTLTNIGFKQILPLQFELSVEVKNLMDIRYADRADTIPFSGGTPRYFVGEPRSTFVTLTKVF